MKLAKLVFDKKYTASQNVKNSVIMQAMAYGKIYELLHKQIWRKAPWRIATYTIPQIPTHNGRPVTFVRLWNIKSPAVVPYSYGGGDYTFGLNQLFMGQDYRKTYIGDPKGGIYHDDCYITPKMIPTSNENYYDCWAYYTKTEFDNELMQTVYTVSNTFDKQDNKGIVKINNVSLILYTKIENNITSHYKKLVIDNKEGEDTIVDLGSYDPLKPQMDGILIGKSDHTHSFFGYRKWKKEIDEFSNHGSVVIETQTSPLFSLETMAIEYGWIRVYQDGAVIEYIPESGSFGGENDYTTPAHYKILPMMYTDTGDLTMTRIEFVEKWNDYFELIVHEDSEWWEALVKPIAVIIVIVVAIYAYPMASEIGKILIAASAVTSSIGILTGDKTFQLIGAVLSLGAGIEALGREGIAKSAMESGLSARTASQIGTEASLSQIFSGFTSNVGLGNLANIGSSIFGVYNDASQLGVDVDATSQPQTQEDKMEVSYNNSEEDDDVYDVYGKIY